MLGLQMSPKSPQQVVDAYLDAIESRDFELARTYLADQGFSYRSTIASFDDPDAFMADVWRVGPVMDGIERRRTFIEGNEVCTIMNFRIRMDRVQVTPVVQLSRVVDGKIVSIEAFFDASEYLKMFDVE
jgi:hypothetical protein